MSDATVLAAAIAAGQATPRGAMAAGHPAPLAHPVTVFDPAPIAGMPA